MSNVSGCRLGSPYLANHACMLPAWGSTCLRGVRHFRVQEKNKEEPGPLGRVFDRSAGMTSGVDGISGFREVWISGQKRPRSAVARPVSSRDVNVTNVRPNRIHFGAIRAFIAPHCWTL